MDWHTSGWAVEPVAGNDSFMWIRTPYTPDYFKRFAPIANDLANVRVNPEGTIDIQYMAQIGDPSLFLGARPPGTGAGADRPRESAGRVRQAVARCNTIAASIVPTGSASVSRVHKTRVEVDAACGEAGLDILRGDTAITDVVIVAENDIADALPDIRRILVALRTCPHINAVRLRSLKFNHAPESFTPVVIEALADLNRLTTVRPLRLEIEAQFLTADAFRPIHARLTRLLSGKGVTVYNNTPLLGQINDTPDAIQDIAFTCRKYGVEFHHLYVAGLPVQDHWNPSHPVSLNDVVDICTRVRREGSGREVPRYIIRTVLGEADFGLSSAIVGKGEHLSVKLLPYTLSYFRDMSPDFQWPEGVTEDAHGNPIVPVAGLMKTTDFALC
jgi:hypothetical protein